MHTYFLSFTKTCIWAALLSKLGICSSDKSNGHLQLTALISNSDGNAQFECWEMAKPFSQYPTVGQSITGLAAVRNVSYVVLPPRSSEGLHKPPHPMYVHEATP